MTLFPKKGPDNHDTGSDVTQDALVPPYGVCGLPGCPWFGNQDADSQEHEQGSPILWSLDPFKVRVHRAKQRLSAGRARDHPVMEIVPNKALSLSLLCSCCTGMIERVYRGKFY